MATQSEIREQITQKIVEALQSGKLPPWRRPWSALENAGHPGNVVSKKPYSGVNPLILELVSRDRGYQSRWWGTFRQWSGLGFRVKARPSDVEPGCWGTKVVFMKPVVKKVEQADDAEADEDRVSRFFLLRQYTVFNAQQIEGEGIEEYLARPRSTNGFVDFEPAEAVIVRATKADIRHGGDKAFYSPTGDFIQLPVKESFESQVAYYSTVAHEACHWTGHESRLDRLKKHARFGSASYAFEELVAEMGGCFLCGEVGVPQSDDLTNHQSYLANWLSILKADPTAIFTASSQASRAVDFVLAFSRKDEGAEADEEEAAVAGE